MSNLKLSLHKKTSESHLTVPNCPEIDNQDVLTQEVTMLTETETKSIQGFSIAKFIEHQVNKSVFPAGFYQEVSASGLQGFLPSLSLSQAYKKCF